MEALLMMLLRLDLMRQGLLLLRWHLALDRTVHVRSRVLRVGGHYVPAPLAQEIVCRRNPSIRIAPRIFVISPDDGRAAVVVGLILTRRRPVESTSHRAGGDGPAAAGEGSGVVVMAEGPPLVMMV